MYCSRCAAPGPLWDVTFHRNIGLIAGHIRRTTPLQACKKCVHKEYWKHFAVLVTVGWTSYYSVVIGPVFLVMNTVNYVKALTARPSALPPASDGPPPQYLPPAN